MKAEEWKMLDKVYGKLDPELRASLARIIIKQDNVLWILRRHPKWRGSLDGLLWLSRYYKGQKKEITKETLENHDIPFEVDEFRMIVKWMEETE